MYAIYKQTHPPTGVEHSAFCHFFNTNEANLVVAGTTNLRVYRFYTEEEKTSVGTSSDKTTENFAKKKLELLCQYSLFGNIESLDAIQLAGNSRDSLLLSFSEAKLAIIDFDPATHDIKTRSLHFFEDEEIKLQKRLGPAHVIFIPHAHLLLLGEAPPQ